MSSYETTIPATVTVFSRAAAAQTPTPVVPSVIAPTSTSSLPAMPSDTPDPNLGVGDVVYADPLDGRKGWDWRFDGEPAQFAFSDTQLNAMMTQGNVGARFAIGPAVHIGDQQVRVTVRIHLCYERDEYGLMFRTTVDAHGRFNAYLFKVACGGSARVERLQSSQPTVLVDWTPSPAIVPRAPAENTLMIWMAQDQFHFYVNGKYLFSIQDKAYAEGAYGIYLRDRTSGGETVSFTALSARAIMLP